MPWYHVPGQTPGKTLEFVQVSVLVSILRAMAHKHNSGTHKVVSAAIEAANLTPVELARRFPKRAAGAIAVSSHGYLMARLGNAILELPETSRTILSELERYLILQKLRRLLCEKKRVLSVQERVTLVRQWKTEHERQAKKNG